MDDTTPARTPGGKVSRTGPEARTLIAYLESHTGQPLPIGLIAAATGLEADYIGSALAHKVAHPRGHIRIWRNLEGRLRRVKTGVYWVDANTTDEPVTTTPTTTSPDREIGLAPGNLMEVIKVYENGRVILTCEEGRVYAGTLRLVDEG